MCGLRIMASGKKWTFDEVEVSEMVVSPSTVVHGVSVGDVSPVKESRIKNGVKLFESRFMDEKKVVRMVSFEPKLKSEVDQVKESWEGVAIINCAVKTNSKEMEIVCGSKTKLVSLPKNFKIDTSVASSVQLFCSAKDVALEEVGADNCTGLKLLMRPSLRAVSNTGSPSSEMRAVSGCRGFGQPNRHFCWPL